MKKIVVCLIITAIFVSAFTGCSGGKTDEFDAYRSINVVSREDGSGTRGAFIELFGIEEKRTDGGRKDLTTKEAVIANKTDVMLANVETDKYAIGYISMSSLNEKVKAVTIDGADATAANVKNGTYKISRPFNIVTKGEVTGLAKDFIDFILSKEGQEVVAKGYIPVNDNADAYAGSKPSGKIVVAGSSSVAPIMEKLKEAYVSVNQGATIEIQMSDSTSGVTGIVDGTCDIGMASRDLKDSEKDKLTSMEIALDGIAVVVNKDNTVLQLTEEQVKAIYVGKAENWSDVTQ